MLQNDLQKLNIRAGTDNMKFNASKFEVLRYGKELEIKTATNQDCNPESPHRQCDGLAFGRSRVRVLAAANLVICSPHFHQGVLPCEGWVVTASQSDLPSLTPLSVVGCGRLQLGAANWATSVALVQVVDN